MSYITPVPLRLFRRPRGALVIAVMMLASLLVGSPAPVLAAQRIVTSVSPLSGCAGDTVTITGSGFETGDPVAFALSETSFRQATTVSLTSTQAVVTVPPHPTGGSGVVIVAVGGDPATRGVLMNGFTYNSNCTTPPVVDSPGPCATAGNAPTSGGGIVAGKVVAGTNGTADDGKMITGATVALFGLDGQLLSQGSSTCSGFTTPVGAAPGVPFQIGVMAPAGFAGRWAGGTGRDNATRFVKNVDGSISKLESPYTGDPVPAGSVTIELAVGRTLQAVATVPSGSGGSQVCVGVYRTFMSGGLPQLEYTTSACSPAGSTVTLPSLGIGRDYLVRVDGQSPSTATFQTGWLTRSPSTGVWATDPSKDPFDTTAATPFSVGASSNTVVVGGVPTALTEPISLVLPAPLPPTPPTTTVPPTTVPPAPPVTTVPPVPGESLPGVPRSLAGADRVGTAIEIAVEDFEEVGVGATGSGRVGVSVSRLRAQAAVIVASDSFADAITAGPLAFAKRGPLLLTSGGQLDERTKSALGRLVPAGSTVYLVGGSATLKPAVVEAVTALGYVVERISGDDRYGTAVAVAERGLGAPSTVFVATGLDFPDALAAGAVAARVGAAVVLSAGDKVPAALAAYLAKYPNTKVVAVGGPASRAFPNATSVRGDDRYATAAALAMAYPATGTVVGVASGSSFPDGLASTTFLARRGGVLLLVGTAAVPESTRVYLAGNRTITTTQVFGGLSVVSDDVRRALAGILTRQ